MTNRRKGQRGFTLIEIMVVVIIIGILASLAVVKVSDHLNKSKIAATEANIKTIRLGMASYEMDQGQNPKQISDLVTGEKHYLDQETVPVDGWGSEFKYFMRGDLVKIQSAGPDKTFDTDDDIVNK